MPRRGVAASGNSAFRTQMQNSPISSSVAEGGSPEGLLQLRRASGDSGSPQHPHPHPPMPSPHQQTVFTPTSHQPFSPRTPVYTLASPHGHTGVAGEQCSLTRTPKPAFPLNVQVTPQQPAAVPPSGPGPLSPVSTNAFSTATSATSTAQPTTGIENIAPSAKEEMPTTAPPSQQETPPAFQVGGAAVHQATPTVVMNNIDHSPLLYRHRALSTFEEESETESISETNSYRQASISPRSSPAIPSSPAHTGSPVPRVRSRRLLNARSSPNIFKGSSKSDVSDEEDEEDDDIVELMTTSGRFPGKNSTLPRMSPTSSPLLTSRRSPTLYLTGSSDDEVGNVFESKRKLRNKRLPFRKRISGKLVRMESISSDDGTASVVSTKDVIRRPHHKRDRLLRLRQYSSLPATSENLNSDSLTELLDNIRRQRSGSCRSNSSLSDGGTYMHVTVGCTGGGAGQGA